MKLQNICERYEASCRKNRVVFRWKRLKRFSIVPRVMADSALAKHPFSRPSLPFPLTRLRSSGWPKYCTSRGEPGAPESSQSEPPARSGPSPTPALLHTVGCWQLPLPPPRLASALIAALTPLALPDTCRSPPVGQEEEPPGQHPRFPSQACHADVFDFIILTHSS